LFNATWDDATPWDAILEDTRAYMTARIAFIRQSAPFVIQDRAGLLAEGQFAKAKMPVLLLRGATSKWTQAINTAIARRLADATQITLPGMGHMGPITHPDAVAASVRTFFEAAQSARP